MAWLLNTIYAALLLVLSPVIGWRMLRHGRYRRGLREKLLGQLPQLPSDRPVVWFHAVSVGEVIQLHKVVSTYRDRTASRWRIVITTSTDTGFDLAVSRFPDCTVSWFPLDFSWAVSAALVRIRPRMVVLTELEFWPGFLGACRERGIATAVINARMSDRSFRGYQHISRLVRPLIEHFSVVAVQTQEYADRLLTLGARAEAVTVTGSVKFDGVETRRENPATQKLRELFSIRPSDIVFIAGSTQDPEEQMVLNAWQQLRSEIPKLRLILVPRHRERFDSVADLLQKSGTSLVRRSKIRETDRPIAAAGSVILLDTIGELSACWGLADVAFVGGSFGSRGGQNMLEPAAYGAAVLFGPNTWNFRHIVRRLLEQEAALEVRSMDAFTDILRHLLADNSLRNEYGRRSRQLVLSQRGAIRHTVELLVEAVSSDVARNRAAA